MSKKKKKPIDNVTVEYLDIALRMCKIQLAPELIDKIIDLVELIEDKGGETSMRDVCALQVEWEQHKQRQTF